MKDIPPYLLIENWQLYDRKFLIVMDTCREASGLLNCLRMFDLPIASTEPLELPNGKYLIGVRSNDIISLPVLKCSLERTLSFLQQHI